MPITLGPMQLIASESTDVIESQVTGTDPDGGFHTNWSRLSGHDHSGGLLGNPVAVTIPDGSITTEDLDESVLAPYARTDGSKPFTGPVTMEADAVVRDTLSFGEQGTTLAPDATLARSGAGALRVGSRLAATVLLADGAAGTARGHNFQTAGLNRWTLQTTAAAESGGNAGSDLDLHRFSDGGAALNGGFPVLSIRRSNGVATWTPDAGNPALVANALGGANAVSVLFARVGSNRWSLEAGATTETGGDAGTPLLVHRFSDAGAFLGTPLALDRQTGTATLTPAAGQRVLQSGQAGQRVDGSGSNQGWGWDVYNGTASTRMTLNGSGTLTVTPVAGQPALTVAGAGSLAPYPAAPTNLHVTSPGNLIVAPTGAYVLPATDGAVYSGGPSNRWQAVYAVQGTIQTSAAGAKEAITPLDPQAALEAVRATPAVTFTYSAPERPPESYELPDDPEQAQAVLEQRLRSAPLEAAARHQAGFLADDCDPLLLTGEGQTNPAHTNGVFLAVLQELDRRLTALETP